MSFNTLTFIVFFTGMTLLYYGVKNWKAQKTILLAGSYLFYAAWNPPFVIILWVSTLIDWIMAKLIFNEKQPGKRKIYLLISLVANLGLLGFFKYGNFFMENFLSLLSLMGIKWQVASSNIILPVGISFYTFQTLSYTLDVYRQKIPPARTFLDFALFVTFFPQLVAGPIVRAVDFIPQCESPRRANRDQFFWGLFLMTLGLFQKVVLADGMLAETADTVFNFQFGPLYWLDAWLGLLAFSGQIFFDFAGYSTCAIGAALCLGFVLPDNFRFPYGAIGFSDFWQRWHITLSSWLRDYLYISLGGSRASSLRTMTNLMFTMLLGGLWHGAGWTFVAWGGLHGFYLIIEHLLRGKGGGEKGAWAQGPFGRFVLVLLTFFLVCLAWVFFRASDFSRAKLIFASLFGMTGGGSQVLSSLNMIQVTVVMMGLLSTHFLLRESRFEFSVEKAPAWSLVGVWSLMAFTLILMQGGGNAFIYFQF